MASSPSLEEFEANPIVDSAGPHVAVNDPQTEAPRTISPLSRPMEADRHPSRKKYRLSGFPLRLLPKPVSPVPHKQGDNSLSTTEAGHATVVALAAHDNNADDNDTQMQVHLHLEAPSSFSSSTTQMNLHSLPTSPSVGSSTTASSPLSPLSPTDSQRLVKAIPMPSAPVRFVPRRTHVRNLRLESRLSPPETATLTSPKPLSPIQEQEFVSPEKHVDQLPTMPSSPVDPSELGETAPTSLIAEQQSLRMLTPDTDGSDQGSVSRPSASPFLTRSLKRSLSQTSANTWSSASAPSLPPLDLQPAFPPAPLLPTIAGSQEGHDNEHNHPQEHEGDSGSSSSTDASSSARVASFATATSIDLHLSSAIAVAVPATVVAAMSVRVPSNARTSGVSRQWTDISSSAEAAATSAASSGLPIPTPVGALPMLPSLTTMESDSSSFIHRRWEKAAAFCPLDGGFTGDHSLMVLFNAQRGNEWLRSPLPLSSLPPSCRSCGGAKWWSWWCSARGCPRGALRARVLFFLGFIAPWCWLIGGWMPVTRKRTTRLEGGMAARPQLKLHQWGGRGQLRVGEKNPDASGKRRTLRTISLLLMERNPWLITEEEEEARLERHRLRQLRGPLLRRWWLAAVASVARRLRRLRRRNGGAHRAPVDDTSSFWVTDDEGPVPHHKLARLGPAPVLKARPPSRPASPWALIQDESDDIWVYRCRVAALASGLLLTIAFIVLVVIVRRHW